MLISTAKPKPCLDILVVWEMKRKLKYYFDVGPCFTCWVKVSYIFKAEISYFPIDGELFYDEHEPEGYSRY